MRFARTKTQTDLVKTEDYSLRAGTEAEQAFLRRYERLYEPLCEYAAAYLDPDAARDATQRAMLRIYKRWETIWVKNPPDSFFYAAVRREARFIGRSAARYAFWCNRFVRQVQLPLHRAGQPDLKLDSTEFGAAVSSAVSLMPEQCREVWRLLREQDLSYAEAAAVLDLTPSTVRVHMWRARRLVQAALIAAGHLRPTAIAAPTSPKLLPAPTAEERDHE